MAADEDKGLTPRQELFCRHLAEGMSAAGAARLAGYAPGNARQSGHELLAQPYICRRITEIRSDNAARRQRDVAAMIAELEELRQSARYCGSYGAAVRAVEMKARLMGLFGDRLPMPFGGEEEEEAVATGPLEDGNPDQAMGSGGQQTAGASSPGCSLKAGRTG